MALILTTDIGDIKLIQQSISAADSRRIINDNFTHLKKLSKLLLNFKFDDLEGIIFPSPIIRNLTYGFKKQGQNWSMVPIQNGFNIGIKNVLKNGDDIVVPIDYQYIVYNQLVLDGGSITIDGGELVIL